MDERFDTTEPADDLTLQSRPPQPPSEGLPTLLSRADDFTLMPDEFWRDLDTGVRDGSVGLDYAYRMRRQWAEDDENPFLQDVRRQRDQREAGAVERAVDRGLSRSPAEPGGLNVTRDPSEAQPEVYLETTRSAAQQQARDADMPSDAEPLASMPARHGVLVDTALGAVRGPLKTLDSMGEGAAAFYEWATGLDIEHIRRSSIAGSVVPGEPETTPGAFVQGLTQWLAASAPIFRAMKGAQGATWLRTTMAGLLADPAADFLAFEPNDPRLANLINEWFPGAGGLVTEYLAATGDDAEIEGRIKNVIEGLITNAGVGVTAAGVMQGLRLMKKARAFAHEHVRYNDRGELALGQPRPTTPVPNVDLQSVARGYNKAVGLPELRDLPYVDVDEGFARRIADAYQTLKHAPNNPRVQRAYASFRDEVAMQWDYLIHAGYTMEPWTGEGQPYRNPAAMRADVLQNKHLYFFTGGDLPADHPMAGQAGDGLTYNNKFRAVHDIFGYARSGFEFGPRGEENAFRDHWGMFSPLAQEAMATETRGQSSWVNFGAHLSRPDGSVPKPGEADYRPLTDRPYADQKAGLLDRPLRSVAPHWARERHEAGVVSARTKLPFVETAHELAKAGADHAQWYHGLGTFLRRQLGREDAELLLDLMALASPGQRAGAADLDTAIDAFTRYKAGESAEEIYRNLRVAGPTSTLIKTLLSNRLSGKSFEDTLVGPALKVRNYRRALGGDLTAVVVDRWMWKVFYPDDAAAHRAKWETQAAELRARGEPVPGYPGWDGGEARYRLIEAYVKSESRKLGMMPADFQAAMWAGQKLLAGDTRGIEPMKAMVRARIKAGELPSAKGAPGRFVNAHTAAMLGLAMAAAAGGYYAGDTDEQRVTFALMAAGVSGPTAHGLAPSLAKTMQAEGQTLRMIRFMSKDVGEVLDPSNPAHRAHLIPGAEERRRREPGALPRLHYYMQEPDGSFRPESGAERGRYVHVTSVPAERIYDLGADPAGFRQRGYRDVHELFRAIHEAGYVGFHNSESGAPNIAGVWEPLGTRQAQLAPGQDWRGHVPEFEPGVLPHAMAGGSDAGPQPILPDTPDTIAAKYRQAVIEQRRPRPRSFGQVKAEADQLIKDGLVSADTIKAYKPGTILDDAQTLATIQVLADSGLRLKALALRAAQTKRPEDITAVMTQLYAHGALDPKRVGIETEAGTTLGILSRANKTATPQQLGLTQFLAQFESIYHNATGGVTPERIVESLAALKDPGQLADLAAKTRTPGFWELFNEYYVGGMLSGPKTWSVNAIGGLITTPWAVAQRAAAGAVGFGREGHTAPTEALALMHGMYSATLDAWRLAAKSFLEDASQFERTYGPNAGEATAGGTKVELNRRAITAENLNLSGPVGQAVDFLGTAIRFPFRVLDSTDDFFRVINYRGELQAQALRLARSDAQAAGLTGKAFRTYQAEQYARHLADPPLDLKRAANSFALSQTLRAELGEAGQKLQELSQLPGGKLFLTFVKTPVNAAKYAAENTPLGIVMKDFRNDLLAGGSTGDEARGKLMLGGLTMGVFATMTYQGLVTPGWPSDAGLRRNLETIGWQPYSFNLTAMSRAATGGDGTPRKGDAYLSYARTEPLGMVIGLSADLANAFATIPEGEWNEAWAEKSTAVASGVVGAVARNFVSRTWVQGLANTMAAIAEPDRMSQREAGSLLGGLVPFSGAVRQAEQVFDPAMREARTALDFFMQSIPGLSTTVPPRRDHWANPIIPGGIYGPLAVGELKDDGVTKEMVQYGAKAPEVPPSIASPEGPIGLTAEQRDYWAVQRGTMRLDGQTIRESLADMIAHDPDYTRGSAVSRQFLMDREWRRYHQAAYQRTIEHFDDLRRKLDDARDRHANKMDGDVSAPTTVTPLIRSLGR